MSDLMIFEGHKVEVFDLNGEVLFNPYHVGECLELGGEAVRKAISRMNEKQVVKVKNSDVTSSNIRKLNNAGENFLTESGVYKLVFKSRKPNAETFTDWVTDEVLPQLRKTGGYINNTDLFINTYFDDIPEEQKNLVRTCLISIEEKQKKINNLQKENDLLSQKVLQWADRPLINSLVRVYAHSLDDNFRKAWTDFKKELLHQYSINLNSRITAYLNQAGRKIKPKTLDMLDDSELQQALSTAVALCRNNKVDISEIIEKRAI